MNFKIEGKRKSGKDVNYSLDDYNVAKFEFGCLKDVCEYVCLYQNDKGNLKQLKIHIEGV